MYMGCEMSCFETFIQAILVFIKIFLPLFGCVSIFYFIGRWIFMKKPYSDEKILCVKSENTLHINYNELRKTIDFEKFVVILLDENPQSDELAVKIINKKDIHQFIDSIKA